jgi:hypothetical protein
MVAGSAVGRGCAFGARVVGGCVFAVDITMAGGDWSTISDGTKQGIARAHACETNQTQDDKAG